MSLWLRAVGLLLPTVLAACGGGGSGVGEAPPKPNTAPTATVAAGQTVLVGTAVQTSGTATDADGDPVTYTWTLASKPEGSAVTSASLLAPTTEKVGFVPDVAGPYVLSLVASDGKASSAPALVTVTAQGADKLAVSVGVSEPLAGAVTLSLAGPATGPQVDWYADLKSIGNGASVTWDSNSVTNGQVQLLARVTLANGSAVDVKRSVSVLNNKTTLIWMNRSSVGSSGRIPVYISAQSPVGIASVTASLDSTSLGTLNAQNACYSEVNQCPTGTNAYQFEIDGYAVGSGAHTLTVVAVDLQGASKQIVVDLPIANVPRLTVAEPLDGSFVYDTLKVSGGASSDRPGSVNVQIKLGDLTIIQATGPTFSGSYDVAGLATGTYKLTVTATDSTGKFTTLERQIVKASSAALAYTPVMALGAGSELLAAEADKLLYRTGDGVVHLLDTLAGTNKVLQDVSGGSVDVPRWQLVDGRAYAVYYLPGCKKVCLFQWDIDGSVKDLNVGNPWAAYVGLKPVVRFGYVLWWNTGASLTLYNIAAGTYRQVVTAPTNASPVLDMAMVGGVLNVFYSADSGDASKGWDVYRWSANTGAAVDLASGAFDDQDVLSDGVRVAWYRTPLGDPSSSKTLVTTAVAGGPATVVSTKLVGAPTLKDGVLAWTEASRMGDVDTIKVATASGLSTLIASASEANVVGNEAGYVFYTASGKLYYWSAERGVSTLLADTAGTWSVSSGKTVYFLSGSSGLLFKVKVN